MILVQDRGGSVTRGLEQGSALRRVSLDEREFLGEHTIRQFRLNAPAGGWFPVLRSLSWTISTDNLPYIDLLFSPHLETVSIYTPRSWNYSGFPRDILPALTPTISALPTSALRTLSIGTAFNANHRVTPWAYFKGSFSSAILRCGPSLAHLPSPIPLSDGAADHVIRLPRPDLGRWGTSTERLCFIPPIYFPPLTEFGLGEASACE